MRQEIKIGNRTLGENQPLFIMAECGVTCNYDVGITKKLIDVVAESGADGIKFIFWFPDEIISDKSIDYSYETTTGKKTENMYQMLSKLKFSFEQWQEVKAYADEKDVVFFSTVNSPTGILWAEKLKLDAYKLSSWDFNYIPLWREIAQKGKPMIIDTGPVNSDEVKKVLDVMQEEGNDQSILVHCYHTDTPKEVNMRSIPYMQKEFQSLVGFSAKDLNDEMDIVGVTLGSCFLEKRLTLDRSLPGHHHAISKEPDEFKRYVEMIRDVHASLGEESLIPSKADLSERKKWFRRLVANRDLKAGMVLTKGDLEGKRPEVDGISPEYFSDFVGKKLKRDLKENEPIKREDV